MTDFTVIRGGQNLATGDDRALFLKVWGGEVFTSFAENYVFGGLTMQRTISNGKSAQFPSIGGKVAAYRTPGAMTTGVVANLTETLITVDAFVESASVIAELDEAMAHFDYRQPFTREDGIAIARLMDQNISYVLAQAALETTSRFQGGNTPEPYLAKTVGTQVDVANSDTQAAALKGAITSMAQSFDEKDVPEMDRYLALRPAQWHLLVNDNDTQDLDLGGIADKSMNRFTKALNGFKLVKSNYVPNTNVTGTYGNKYNVDARNTVALAWTPGAVGTLKVRDLSVHMTGDEYKATHNATLIASRMLCGHGKLRDECAGIIRTGAPV